MCLPQVIKSFQKYRGVATTFYPTLVYFIHLAVCLTSGPKPPPKQALHTVRSRASSFKWEYPLLSLRSSSSFLHLLPVTSITPFIFPSITRCRRQFLRKMWPIQLAFRLLTSCRILLCSLTLIPLHFSHTRSNWYIYVRICVCVCIYVYIYIYMFIFIFIFIFKNDCINFKENPEALVGKFAYM